MQSPIRAAGTFKAKISSLPLHEGASHEKLGRMSIDKEFLGDLAAVSQGEMLTAGTGVPGSAGYVAIERVEGALHGRRGSFALQHTGTMNRGVPELSVTVVPDSGTDELTGLTGSMTIQVSDGAHSYDFEYRITPGE